MIENTRPFLPPIEEYQAYIEQAWDRNWLTNNGPLVNQLELSLKDYLNLDHLLYISSGTMALQLAIKALELHSEVITTPFSYVATASSLVWQNCEPVFVDIDKDSFNLDPRLIEAAITEKTTGIVATHVYGNPCNIEAIEEIARKHKLKVIFDGAQSFGSKYQGRSVLGYGDISIVSFHATKLFHSIEGGAVITKDPSLLKTMAYLRNFGHDGPSKFNGAGINAKNSEIHAAMGLANLKYADAILSKRRSDHQLYDQRLDQRGFQKPFISDIAEYNFSYYPIVFSSEEECLDVQETLQNKGIVAKRYFYPLLSDLDYVKQTPVPVANSIAQRVLCLPLYEQITKSEIDMICRIILRSTPFSANT